MNLFTKIVLLCLAFSVQAFALETEPCAAGVYCIERLTCVKRVQGKVRGMADDWYVMVVQARAFKSVKNLLNGKKGLVDSLMVNDEAFGTKNPKITLDEAKKLPQIDYGNYGGPAKLQGKRVWISRGTFSKGLELQIVSSSGNGPDRIDHLVGVEKTVGDVVPDHVSKLECDATVVSAPSLVVDNTK